ncbi:hypothetical protein R4K54_08425 [Brachyspira murdochii]|uniref:hypothetical protein n=1 Tax=Brachyspira murdochii TaxID=84378 RepID=UPI003007432B
MKKTYLLFLVIISMFMMSCGGHFFNPRYYYNKSSSTSTLEDGTPADVDLGIAEVPTDQDPFLNGQWNSIDYQFDGSKILEFLFAASFDGNNVPVYTFFKDGTVWTLSDAATAENKYKAQDGANKAQGYSISDATFYRYDYKNPLIAPENSYNKSERMKRFVFYRLVGNAVVVPLNNYLIAVDTYSKLVFAYGKITKTGSTMGQAYPTAFEAVELHGEKRPFYEYDPIGFMAYDASSDSLKLTLYEEYQNEMAKDANAYFPQVHDASRGIAYYDGPASAGRSPYYYVNVADIDPKTILDKLVSKTYGTRNKLMLYNYSFSEDGRTVTVTSTYFYEESTPSTTEYTFSKVTGATSVEYTNSNGAAIVITGLGTDFEKIKDEEREYTLNYQDPGPDFIYRVAGKIYKNPDDKITYEFSVDGMSFKYTDGSGTKTYYFSQQSDPSEAKAAYSQTGSVFWGIKLSDHNNTKDGQISGAVTEAGMINPGMAMTGTLASYVAYIDASTIPSQFVETVSGKTYFYRNYQEPDSGNGNSLNAYKYVFNKDASELTYTEMVYKQEDVSTKYKLKSVSGSKAVYINTTDSSKTLNLALGMNPNMIYDDTGSSLADCTASDKGPFFLDIVRGSEYIAEDKSYSYKFSSDGKLLTFTYASGESTQYDYTQTATEYFKAAYKQQNTWFPRYWALRVTSLGGVLEMSTGSLAFPTDILRDASYGWKAILGSGTLVKDAFLSAVAGRVFKVRNSSNSLLLDRYTFSSGGAFITYEQIDWYTDKVVDSTSITYDQYIKVSDTKGIYKYTDASGNSVSITFSVDSSSPSTLSKDNAVAGYYNYQDPGPNFVDRVKGKTYVKSDGEGKYVFSSDGLTLTDYDKSGEKIEDYKFAEVDYEPVGSDFVTGDRAIYERPDRPWYEAAFPYWGLKLVTESGKKDYKLYWTGSAWGSTGTTPAENADSYESTRQD